MKTNTKFLVAALGVGMAVVLVTGCHHFGGGCCARSSVPPAVNAAPPSAPAPANAPAGHQH